MAGNKQRFTYEINADIGQAKKAINDLQRSIDNLSKKQISTNYLDAGINKAVNSAKELQYHLNKALNADTGKLNLNAFSQSLAQSNLSAKDLMQNLLQGGTAGQQAFTSLAGVIAQSEVPLKRMNSTLKNFATTLKNTIKWEISSTMIHGLERSLRGAVSYAKNLNTSLTNIRIVTGQSVDDMARFAKEANVAAKALSTTTKSYADASLIYYQQGDSQEMAAKKAAITIKAANSSFESSAKEMSEYLTAVWNSYQVGADELERYVDIMASLGAKTATSLEEIATSMQKVAATANTVGVSMEQVSSIIATVSSVTRESAESIGTSYKTIFARIGDLKLGQTDEDGIGLGQVSSQLDAIGVKILDESGNLREMGDIIIDLGTKWQTMNQAQKTAIAQVVAGKRQYTQLMALFENWDMFQSNMNIAENSEGSLQKMADTYAESWQAASNKVRASLESIYGQIFEDQTIIKLMNQTSGLIEAIDKVINGFGGIGGVLKTIGALSITVFQQQIGNSINQVIKNIKMFTTQFKGQSILQIGKSLSSGSAKNVEQLQLQERTKEWSNLFSSMKSTNEVEQIALQNSTSLLNAKDQLIAAEHKLTQAQKDRAVFTLEQLSQEQSKLLAVAQERQALAQQSISNRKSDYLKVTTAIVNNDNVTRQSAQNTLNNVYRAQGGYEGALKKYEEHTYANTAAFNIKSTLQSTNDIQAAIQQTKKSLSKYIDSKYLDDATLDAKTLIGLLDQVIRKTNRANKRMYDKARSIPGKYAQEQARAGFDNSQARGEEKYNVDSQMTGLQRSVAGIKSTFTQLLNPASEASKTLGSTLTKVAGTAMSVAGAMSSAGSMVRAFTADTFDLTSALSSFSGVAMNLAMGFSTGGIWGLMATGLATVIGTVSEISKVQKEFEQKKFEEVLSDSSDRVSKINEEENSLQNLLSVYNDLYSRFKNGEDVQNELSDSAIKLAEAYGLTGAAVAAATGNFDLFNQRVSETIDLSKQVKEAQGTTKIARSTIRQNKLENQERESLSFLTGDTTEENEAYFNEINIKKTILSKASGDQLYFGDLLNNNSNLLEELYNSNKSYFINYLLETLKKQGIDTGIDLNKINLNPISWNDWQPIINQYLDELNGVSFNDFLNIGIQGNAGQGVWSSEAESKIAEALSINIEALGQNLIMDYAELIDDKGKLIWNDNSDTDTKVARFNEYKQWYESLSKLLPELESGSADYNNTLLLMDEIGKIINDKGLSQAISNYEKAKASETILTQAEKIIGKTLGKDTSNYDFSDYQQLFTEVSIGITDNKDAFKELEGLTEGTDEFNKARDALAAQIINDYTVLDDWTQFYLTLTKAFSGNDLQEALKYAEQNLNPKDLTTDILSAMQLDLSSTGQIGRMTNTALAAQTAKQSSIESQNTYEKIKQISKTYDNDLEISEATAIYDTFFSENKKIINDAQLSWKQFLALDMDARKTYLETVSESYLIHTKKEAQLALESAEKEKIEFDKSNAAKMLTDDNVAMISKNLKLNKQGMLTFTSNNLTIEEQQAISEQASAMAVQYGFIDKHGVGDTQAFLEAYSAAQIKSEQIKQNIINATNTAKGFELLDSNGDRAIDKITRLGNIVSKLPEDSKEFKKLMDQLPNEVTESSLINMTELGRAELILKNLDKPLEENFIDVTTGKVDWAEYNKALAAWEEANKTAVDIILESADAAFTQIENRMNHAREEAEKTKIIAETLSGTVQTGELTETQKLGMDANLLKAWNETADAPARAAIAMQQWNKYANENAMAARELLTIYSTAKNAIFTVEDIISTGALKDSEKGKENFRGMLAQMDLDDEIKSVWEKAWDQAVSKGIKFDGKSDFEIIELLRNEIGEMSDLTKEEMDAVTAAVKDNMAEMFQELHDQNIEQARSAADAWREAFDLINDAKLKLLSGESILEMIAGDPQAIMTLAQQTGLSIQEILQGAISNTLDPKEIQDFDINEYVDAEMLASGMFEGFGESIYKDMLSLAPKGTSWDKEDGWTDVQGNKISERDILGPVYETMLKASNPQATQQQINKWLDQIFTDPSAYMDLLVNSMSQLESATSAAGQALQSLTDTRQIEAAGDIKNTEAEFRGQKVEYKDLTEVQAAIDRAQQAKYDGKTWESLSQEDRDLLGEYGINFTNVDTAATECATALADCAGAAVQLMEAMARDKGYTYSEQEKAWGRNVAVDTYSDGTTTYTEEEGRSAYGTDWDTYKTGLTKGTSTRWTASKEITEVMQEGQEAVEKANGAIKDTDYQTMERMASSVGMTIDEFERYKESVSEALGEQHVFNQNTEEARKKLEKYAHTLAAMDKAFKELQGINKETWKLLSDESKSGTTDYIKNLNNLRKMAQKLFPNNDPLIDDDFVKANIKNFQKMAEGTEEEALEAQDNIHDALAQKYVATLDLNSTDAENALNLLTEKMDQWDDKDLHFEITADGSQAEAEVLDSLNSMVMAGTMTAEQITAALNSIGWQPNIQYMEHEVTEQDKSQGFATATILGKTYTTTIDEEAEVGSKVRIPYIASISKMTPPGGGSRSSNKGGGGGGKTQKKEKKDKIRGRDEIERYHKNNDTIERISANLEKIDKLKDRAYGKDHIAQIEAETDALNKQLLAQQNLHDEALKWMAADKADLAKYGAEYDENGTIVNYEKVMERIIDEYNSAIERYNNSGQGDGDKLALEAAEQIFEDAKKAIENYEEALGIANDSANEMLEIQNQMSELEVEKITYELELKMDMNERDLEMLEYYQEKYSEELENQDKLFNTFIQSAAEYEDNLAQLGKAYEDLSRQYAAGLINEAHYAEAVTELQEEIVDNLNSLQEIQSELVEAYSETLELAREEIERTTDAIDHSNEALQSFMDITRLTGNDAEYKKIGKFYDQMYANNLTKIEVQKAHLNSLLEEEERFQEKIRNGQQLTELEKAEYAALSEQIQETRDTLLSSVVESLEVVRESYENTINSIADDLDNFMAGAAGSMEYLQEQYGYFQEEQERYVSTTKELYEVSKLNRDIEGTLATTTSSAAKEALKALQEKINKQSELNELTEYDIEMNQLQYQLLLARIKLEESQNAKDTVRLTRDENGNYAYRYTANQDKIDEAAQHYEDVLQQINDTTVQRTSEIEQQLLNTMSNYKEKFQEIATDYSLTEEERLMRLEELNNQFSETMRYLQEQNNIVTNNLTANQEAIAGHYGATMSEITASTAGNVNNTIQSMIDKTEEYIAAMNNAIFGEEGAQSAWQKYLAQLGDVEGSADVAYDSLLGNAQEMGEMNGFAAEEALEVIQTLRDTLDPLEALSSAWDAHNTILEATISNYENLAQVIQGTLSAIGQIPNGGTANVDGAHRYAKGGLVDYTGLAWVDGTASDPEMMLNPGDTQNILKATAMVKSLDSGFIGSLVESVKSAAAAMLHMFGGAYHAVTNVHTANDSALDQNVHITAEFPNVQNHTEIEEAFDNLINQAAQFAHRKN